MRQRDIEKLAAAAYELSDPTAPIPFAAVLRMRAVLSQIDPHGLLRPGTLAQDAAAAQTCEAPEPSLRDSPRMQRASRDAWPPRSPVQSPRCKIGDGNP